MKNTFKIIPIAFISLFLFACDAGTSKKKTTEELGSFTVSVAVVGLVTPRSVTVQNNSADDQVISADSTKAFSSSVADGAAYSVTVSKQPIGLSCSIPGVSSGTIKSSDVTIKLECVGSGLEGIAANGQIYYDSECAVCHKAGVDDTMTAFKGQDIASKYQIQNRIQQFAYIKSDIHDLGSATTNFMGRFDKIPGQSVADLMSYLGSVTLATVVP